MSKENYEAKLSRLRQMTTDDGGTWDLSCNDQAAIKFALDLIKTLGDELAAVAGVPGDFVVLTHAAALDNRKS